MCIRDRARLQERERIDEQAFRARQERIDADEQAAYDRLDAETGRKRVLSAEEQAYEDRRAKIAADAEQKRQKLEKDQDAAERRRARERAAFEKKQAVWRIVLATAQGVAVTLARGGPLAVKEAVAIGLTGAVQAALVAAQPIPQFATGVLNFQPPGGAAHGLALVGERGPELVSLGRGANVVTNENTRALLERVAALPSRSQAPAFDDRRLVGEMQAMRHAVADLAGRIEAVELHASGEALRGVLVRDAARRGQTQTLDAL